MLFSPRELGQGLVEYALILILIAMVVIIVLGLVGDVLIDAFNRLINALP
jgi:pilus assembly protein Flp/PilA